MDQTRLNLASSKRKWVSCAGDVHLVVTEMLPMGDWRRRIYNADFKSCNKLWWLH